jgi:hypothetical protein
MDRQEFCEALLTVMEQKTHWAWPAFQQGKVHKSKFHIHLEQEYATYIRDFAVLVGRAYVACPFPAVRAELAENLYEEETGGLVAGRPHAELFLEYPKGLGMDLSRFANITLLPAAQTYRDFVDEATQYRGWEVAAALATIFIEGTSYERGEIDPKAPKRPEPPLEQHPLVRHYGLPVEHLALTKAHRKVEGNHRVTAWRLMLDHVPADRRFTVVTHMKQVLRLWKAYRDDVAVACGLTNEASLLSATHS